MKNRILLIFQGKNTKFFDTKTYFKSQISAFFRSFRKQMVFSAIEARFRRIFMRIIGILPGFSNFFQTIQGQGSEISDFQARESLLRLIRKLD